MEFVKKFNLSLVLEGIVIGFIVFAIIYGFGPLDVTNDKWIMSGYDESDIIQHYAGWCAFRNSAWHYPLGLADNMEDGTYISFTDSIPWLAIFFKLTLQIVHYDGTFQYLGGYALLCYILQAIATGLLIRRKTDNHFIICTCMIFLCFSPILMERSLRHTTLGSQWFILFALYAYLKFRERKCKKFPISFGILAFLAVGIHPYFLPLILVFSFLSVLSCFFRKINILKNLWGFIYSILLPVIGGRLIGALGTDVNASRGGYGYYSMNLNATFNPISAGGYDWSNFFKVHPQILGNYDGFNYLGLGYLFLISIAALSLLITLPRWNRYKTYDVISYVITAILMTVFAISNVVTFNDRILVTIPLSDELTKLCGIFRASSRMFYFTYYSLVIFSLYRILVVATNLNLVNSNEKAKQLIISKKISISIVLVAVSLIQIVDLGHVVIQKHIAMTQKIEYKSILDDSSLAEAVKEKRYLVAELDHDYGSYRTLGAWAGKNNLVTSFTIASDVEPYTAVGHGHRIMIDFINGKHDDDVVLAYRDISLAKKLFQNEKIKSSCRYLESNGFAFIIAESDTRSSNSK